MFWLDIILVAFILWLAWTGLRKGLVREIFDLSGAVLGLYIAAYYHQELARFLTRSISLPVGVTNPLAFGLLALSISITLSSAGLIWSRYLQISPLRLIDTILGAGLGFAKGFLLLMIILTFLTMLASDGVTNILAESVVAEAILLTVPAFYNRLEGLIPEQLPARENNPFPGRIPAV